MRSPVLLLVTAAACVAVVIRGSQSSPPRYTNVWAVGVEGGKESADALAEIYHFVNKGQVGILKDVYEFELPEYMYTREGRALSEPYDQITEILKQEVDVKFAEQQVLRKVVSTAYTPPTDPCWPQEWFLLNTEDRGLMMKANASRDLKVEPAWIQGCTGNGVKVGVVDDGVDYTHLDLSANYLSDIDINVLSGSNDATPELTNGKKNSHGTNCAGVIAMEKNNDKCGVGVAYKSSITGIVLIGGRDIMDMDEAKALSHRHDVIDIYSNSWGLEDDGKILQKPLRCTEKTLQQVTKEGRNGKGSIFVWAAGNGGDYDRDDSCAANGYVNSIYTIAVGSVGSDSRPASYDERCSAKMATAFVHNRHALGDGLHVATTGVNGSCYKSFDGTSAATPVVSGTIALALEANPDLTWRDVQYLIAYTSNPDILTGDDWVTNAAGLKVNHNFGFGAIDAEAMVTRARYWTNVPDQKNRTFIRSLDDCHIYPIGDNPTKLFTCNFAVDIVYLEHVVVQTSLTFKSEENPQANRGDIQLHLTSPQKTTSILLPYRRMDTGPNNYTDWPFMSVHFWGENPTGLWSLNATYRGESGTAIVGNFQFTFYGTTTKPDVIARIPSRCDSACARARGCAAAGSKYCDSCRLYRNAITLECMDECSDGFKKRNGYCYKATEPEAQCVRPSICPFPAGSRSSKARSSESKIQSSCSNSNASSLSEGSLLVVAIHAVLAMVAALVV